jgi:hypothetical protein
MYKAATVYNVRRYYGHCNTLTCKNGAEFQEAHLKFQGVKLFCLNKDWELIDGHHYCGDCARQIKTKEIINS